MANADLVRTIFVGLDEFQEATLSSYEVLIHGYDQEGPQRKVIIRLSTVDNLQFEFKDVESAVIWATNLALHGPNAASIGFQMMQLEQAKADQIILNAKVAALEQVVGDVGITAPIQDAIDAAAAILAQANASVSNLQAEKTEIEEAIAIAQAEAAALQAEIDALNNPTPPPTP